MPLPFRANPRSPRAAAPVIVVYIALAAVDMGSRLPTYLGKTIGQRVSREMVLPILAATVLGAVLLIAYT